MRIRTLADGSTAHGESDATVPDDATTIEILHSVVGSGHGDTDLILYSLRKQVR